MIAIMIRWIIQWKRELWKDEYSNDRLSFTVIIKNSSTLIRWLRRPGWDQCSRHKVMQHWHVWLWLYGQVKSFRVINLRCQPVQETESFQSEIFQRKHYLQCPFVHTLANRRHTLETIISDTRRSYSSSDFCYFYSDTRFTTLTTGTGAD